MTFSQHILKKCQVDENSKVSEIFLLTMTNIYTS